MKNYRTLALRYLKMNKKRSRITIGGVVVTTMILFLILNLAESYLFQQQKEIRKETDYEMVLFTETQEQISEVIADARIRSAYVGSYVYIRYSFNEGWITTNYDKALFVNIKNPYQISSVFASLCSTYGLEGEINDILAATYFQTGENLMAIMILTILLVSFIFAIFGVGIVRNSIQLCILESIRDYGNLRCIGAATGQLKSIIYTQGAVLELTGIGIGVVFGTIISMITGAFLHMAAGFHILPVLFILIVFLGDLYFAMQENCKLVVGMTPVSAIRGEYRIRKEKIKLRKNRLITKLLGVDGDYAYKSIMRNFRRFTRTVSSIVFGIGGLITVVGFVGSLNHLITRQIKDYGYYQLYFEGIASAYSSITEVQSFLPSTEILERLIAQEEITEGKRMYASEMLLADVDVKYDHFFEEIGKEQDFDYKNIYEHWLEADNLSQVAGVFCYGYDEADYRRYESVLVEGTLDISENGIVLVNYGDVNYELDSGTESQKTVCLTDYQLGDTIDIVDMKELRDRIDRQRSELWEETQAKIEDLLEQEWDSGDKERDEMELELRSSYQEAISAMVHDCWEELVEEGRYKTYTIEGFVSRDVNHIYNANYGLRMILPLEHYFEMTGTDASMSTGMQYHFSRYPREGDFGSLVFHEMRDWVPGVQYSESPLPWMLDEMMSLKYPAYFALGFVVFIMTMSALNIMNATASNLHLRRKEFAQLRVIGVSKKHLMRMVMLEGVITTIVADVIGIILGLGVSYMLFWGITQWFGAAFYVPVGIILLCVLATVLLLCGSIYVSLRDMKQNMAEDLKAGGD